jgi:hypothetical protein
MHPVVPGLLALAYTLLLSSQRNHIDRALCIYLNGLWDFSLRGLRASISAVTMQLVPLL